MNEQQRETFRERSSLKLTVELSNEVKFTYQVEDEDETKLLNEDLRFFRDVKQVNKI